LGATNKAVQNAMSKFLDQDEWVSTYLRR
jgi:hypothetical protein